MTNTTDFSKKAQRAMDILANGGEFVYRLKRNSYTGREQFHARLQNAGGHIERGFGFATYHELNDRGLLSISNSTSVSTYYKLNRAA